MSGRTDRLRKAAVENSTPVNAYQATDEDLPEILQGQPVEAPKMPPQSVAAAPAEEAVRPEIVRSERRPIAVDSKIIELFLKSGDLAGLAPAQRVSYYNAVCESVGLNPLTRPFEFISFQGKTILYARRDCADQLRKIHGVSIPSLETRKEDGLYIVVAHATDRNGRTDTATGAVATNNLSGSDLANAIMKAETKAKRRVTLSLCGLGVLDESEIDFENSQATQIVQSAPSRDTEKPVTVAVDAAPKAEVAPATAAPKPNPEASPVAPQGTAAASSQSPTGNGKSVSASPDAYQVLPEAASNSDRLKALEAFCFGKSPSDNRLIRYLPFAVGLPAMLAGPFVIEENGKWNPKKWETEGKKLGDRAERLKFMEQQLSMLGRDMFIKWGEAMVDAARKRGVFGK